MDDHDIAQDVYECLVTAMSLIGDPDQFSVDM